MTDDKDKDIDLRPVVDMLVEGDTESAHEHLLLENKEQQIVRAMGGDRSLMNYLLKFEEYLDDHDVNLFDGWEDIEIHHRPIIKKFWAIFDVYCPEGTDLRGALRITSDHEGQNEVGEKKVEGGTILRFKILRRYLDEIEKRNQEKAEELSAEEMEFL